MKILQFNESLCIGCHNCEETCSKVYFKTEDISKARLRITEKVDDFNRFKGCNQCGDCIDVCPEGAIYRMKNGAVTVDKKICVGCMMCVAFCSDFHYHDDYVEPYKCLSCGACSRSCPTGALTMKVEG
ncbi:4Fe-4S binding protein [Mycoplasmatota bacterium]|nr:4Fe-4S binding protein [Mycoplasmatota bacterium]